MILRTTAHRPAKHFGVLDMKTRHYTNMLLDAVEQGLVTPQSVMEMALSYMSESEVEDMMRDNDLLYFLEPEEELEEE
jgi:hypothetical protein